METSTVSSTNTSNTGKMESVDEKCARLMRNIERRRAEIEADERSVQVVENSLLSESLSSVKGIQRTLSTMRLAKQKKEQEAALDPHSHTQQTVGYLRRK
jgi:hypothetical protein